MHLKALLLIREPIVCCFYSAGKNIFIFVFPNNCLSDFHLASTPIFRMSSKSHSTIVNWIMVSIPENKLPRLQITIHRSSAIFARRSSSNSLPTRSNHPGYRKPFARVLLSLFFIEFVGADDGDVRTRAAAAKQKAKNVKKCDEPLLFFPFPSRDLAISDVDTSAWGPSNSESFSQSSRFHLPLIPLSA